MNWVSLGLWSLALSLLAAVLQFAMPASWRKTWAWTHAGLLSLSFISLALCHLWTDFSVLVVSHSTYTKLPWYYKLSATWSHHEGSMLLWAMLSAWSGVSFFIGQGHTLLRHLTSRVHALIGMAFSGFLLFTSNPFAQQFPAPTDGVDLNPLLQDVGLIVHPPMLYMGYVLCGAIFSLAAGTLWAQKHDDAVWRAPLLQRYIMAAWLFLTTGIAMGSGWAYYELGWGGYWFWDPVENASLIPWLMVTALIHAAKITQRSGDFARHTALYALLSFSAALLGTFLVRSGVVTSVHAFASDPARGVFILAIFFGFTGFSLLSYIAKPAPLGRPLRIIGKRGFLALNTVFLGTIASIVLVGTLYPNILEAINGTKISVGPPYFNSTALPAGALVALLIPLGVLMPSNGARFWRSDYAKKALMFLGVATCAVLALIASVYWPRALLGWAGLLLGAWVMSSSIHVLWQALRTAQIIQWPLILGHAGFALVIWGITGTGDGTLTHETPLRLNQTQRFADIDFTLKNIKLYEGDNYTGEKSFVWVQPPAPAAGYMLVPAQRLYHVSQRPTTEAAIKTSLARNVYINSGAMPEDDQAIKLRVFIHPLAMLLWAGAFLMVLAAVASFWQQKARKTDC